MWVRAGVVWKQVVEWLQPRRPAPHPAPCTRRRIPAPANPHPHARRPLDEECGCMVCRRYTRAFLHPLAAKGLPFAANLISYHNIAYTMVSDARHVLAGWLATAPLSRLAVCSPILLPVAHPTNTRLAPRLAWRSACRPRSGRPSWSSGTLSLCGSTSRYSSPREMCPSGSVRAAAWQASHWINRQAVLAVVMAVEGRRWQQLRWQQRQEQRQQTERHQQQEQQQRWEEQWEEQEVRRRRRR